MFPVYKFNEYNYFDYYEEYQKYYKKYPLFKNTFPTFQKFITSIKKYKPRNIIYLNHVRTEARKHHYLYN